MCVFILIEIRTLWACLHIIFRWLTFHIIYLVNFICLVVEWIIKVSAWFLLLCFLAVYWGIKNIFLLCLIEFIIKWLIRVILILRPKIFNLGSLRVNFTHLLNLLPQLRPNFSLFHFFLILQGWCIWFLRNFFFLNLRYWSLRSHKICYWSSSKPLLGHFSFICYCRLFLFLHFGCPTTALTVLSLKIEGRLW